MPACRENRVARPGRCLSSTLLAATLSVAATTASALPVIPGARGFGTDTPAGRGGTVYRVTNLNASGAGSLPACIAASGPRVCVFEVSGVIRLSENITIRNPYITIAGQTAPSPGIMIRGAGILINTSNVLIQHITIRAGDDPNDILIPHRGALEVDNISSTLIQGIVVDHCTLAWGIDETVDLWKGWDNVTLSNNIISEGLWNSVWNNQHGYANLIGSSTGSSISIIGNLYAHNAERNPLTNAHELVFVNNVIYNLGNAPTMIQGQFGATKSSIVGNVYINGPNTGKPYDNGDYVGIHSLAIDGSDVYLSDNAHLLSYSASQVPLSNQWSDVYYFSGKAEANYRVNSPPVWATGLTAKPVGQVRDWVLANVGSRPADRSAKDKEMVNDVRTGTGNIVNCVSSSNCRAAPYNNNAGGWPVYAQNTRPLTLPTNPGGDADGDGYTNLEEWLHDMAGQVEGYDSTAPNPPSNVAAQ